MTPDPIFAHPRLAPVYDAFDGDRTDLDAYLAIAEEAGARRVLDVGCGTGTLTIRLATAARKAAAPAAGQAADAGQAAAAAARGAAAAAVRGAAAAVGEAAAAAVREAAAAAVGEAAAAAVGEAAAAAVREAAAAAVREAAAAAAGEVAAAGREVVGAAGREVVGAAGRDVVGAVGGEVVGVDPAAESLVVARAKDPEGRVIWIHGDATAAPRLGFDLAVMIGNVAQVFVSDEEWAGTLAAIRAALRPGGWFVFETRRPDFRAWEEWALDTAPVVRDVPGSGLVERRFELLSVDLPLVSFRYSYRFHNDGAEFTSDSTLRFRDRDEVTASLTAAGFKIRDVREAPDRPGREFVFVAERTG